LNIYNTLIALSKPIRTLYRLFNNKFAERETHSSEQLESLISDNIKYDIWFHVASMGEYFQAEPIMKRIKEKDASISIIVSFFSPSGFNNIKDSSCFDKKVYLPFDTQQNARLFIEAIEPRLIIFVRYELWQNILSYASRKNIETWLIAAAPPNSSSSKGVLKSLHVNGLRLFSKVFPVSKESSRFFEDLNIDNQDQLPDPRYDGISEKLSNANPISDVYQLIENLAVGRKILIVGSGWPEDDKVITKAVKNHSESVFTIHAPHEPNTDYLNDLHSKYPNAITLSDAIEKTKTIDTSTDRSFRFDTMIIDRIGLLLSLYKISDMAYVGGGFGAGVHSVGEPFVAGNSIAAGADKIYTSPESKELIENNILEPVNSDTEFQQWLAKSIDTKRLSEVNSRSEKLLKTLLGSAEKYTEMILENLSIHPR
jgi:3-deoxy-D-manno-octulosonic-acid transferase